MMFTVLPCFALDLQKEPKVAAYLEDLSKKYQFDLADLQKLFAQVNFNAEVLKKITKAAGTPPPWNEYRNMLITPERIEKGKAFWKNHQVVLASTQSQYGVPAEIIAGIIGVETSYGDNKGKFPTIDALTTLGFQYPPRSKFFLSELTNYLLLCREQNWDPLAIKGSYAGAMGMPQFMPSSYRSYAVDYHRDGVKNLFSNDDDVIASIGNYLQKKGWKVNQPIAVPAIKTDAKAESLFAKNKKPYSLKKLEKNGIKPAVKVSGKYPATLLVLKNKDRSEDWLAFHNFAVIKRYNSSDYYAMTVYQLGNLVKPDATTH